MGANGTPFRTPAAFPPAFVDAMATFGADSAPATRADVIALLGEVRALRDAVAPPPSVILTGRDVADAMRQLRAREG